MPPSSKTPEPDPPFDSPAKFCPAGHAIGIVRRDPGGKPYGGIEGLVLGYCMPCNLKAALVERILPIWRKGDRPDILEVLTRDMDDSERYAHAMYSDSSDPGWTMVTG